MASLGVSTNNISGLSCRIHRNALKRDSYVLCAISAVKNKVAALLQSGAKVQTYKHADKGRHCFADSYNLEQRTLWKCVLDRTSLCMPHPQFTMVLHAEWLGRIYSKLTKIILLKFLKLLFAKHFDFIHIPYSPQNHAITVHTAQGSAIPVRLAGCHYPYNILLWCTQLLHMCGKKGSLCAYLITYMLLICF